MKSFLFIAAVLAIQVALSITDDTENGGNECKVEVSKLKDKLDMKKILGLWRGLLYYDGADDYSISDVNLKFKMKNGTFKVMEYFEDKSKTNPCVEREGEVTQHDNEPARLTIKYMSGFTRDVWIVSTDYKFALVYSCMDQSDDGDCPKQDRRFHTLTRYRKLSLKQIIQLVIGANRFCLDFNDFKKYELSGQCKKQWRV